MAKFPSAIAAIHRPIRSPAFGREIFADEGEAKRRDAQLGDGLGVAADEPEGTDATVIVPKRRHHRRIRHDETGERTESHSNEQLVSREHGQRRKIRVKTGVIPNTSAACKL